MNQNGGTTPDDRQVLELGAIAMLAWRLAPPPATHDITVTFNVPEDFVNSATLTQVIVHFDTETASLPTTGDVTIEVDTVFTPVEGTLSTPFTTYLQTVTGVTSSASHTSYNHYDAIFTLVQPIAAADLAVLNVTRNATGDTYSEPVGLLSVEFRYTTT